MLFLLFKKNTLVCILNNRIIKYSAIKIIANLLLLYSVLNPETSSLSPSAKSKGVRFSSATEENIHRRKGIKVIKKKNIFCVIKIE